MNAGQAWVLPEEDCLARTGGPAGNDQSAGEAADRPRNRPARTDREKQTTVDQERGKQNLGETRGKDAVRLLQLPGIGVVVAMTILSAIGNIHHFADANHLAGYSGLDAGMHDSGNAHIEKRITKSGRKELRWALIEAGRLCACHADRESHYSTSTAVSSMNTSRSFSGGDLQWVRSVH